jgi:hypothetical protein
MDRVHFVLDVLGLAPVVGEAADLGNSVLYFAEGDVFNGTLSLAAVVPVWGSASTVPRLSQYGDELITFGSRFDINKMHVLKGIDEQVHHLVPWELRYHDVVQIAARDDFHMNDAANGLVLTGYQRFQLVVEELLGVLFKLTPDEARSLQVRGIHASHPAYNKYVEFRLDEFANGFEAIEDITPQEARQFIEHELLTELVTETIQAANDVTRINEHFKVLLAARGWN